MNEQRTSQGQGFWKEHFELWKVSGLTQQAYCLREEISYQSFVYQQNRANKKLKKTRVNFIGAKIKPVTASRNSSGLYVMLPNGVRIGFDGEITAALLQTVFNSVGSIPC